MQIRNDAAQMESRPFRDKVHIRCRCGYRGKCSDGYATIIWFLSTKTRCNFLLIQQNECEWGEKEFNYSIYCDSICGAVVQCSFAQTTVVPFHPEISEYQLIFSCTYYKCCDVESFEKTLKEYLLRRR